MRSARHARSDCASSTTTRPAPTYARPRCGRTSSCRAVYGREELAKWIDPVRPWNPNLSSTSISRRGFSRLPATSRSRSSGAGSRARRSGEQSSSIPWLRNVLLAGSVIVMRLRPVPAPEEDAHDPHVSNLRVDAMATVRARRGPTWCPASAIDRSFVAQIGEIAHALDDQVGRDRGSCTHLRQ